MSRDTAEIAVAVSGDVYVAPVGTPLPSLPDVPLHSSFYKLGLVSADGVSMAVAPEIDDHFALQHSQPVRRELVEQRIALTFDMLQWNAETVVLAFGGGQVTEFVPGQYRYDFPSDDDALDERSIVIDWSDQDRFCRFVFGRGSVLGGVQTTFRRSSIAMLPVAFDVLAVDAGGSPGYMFMTSEPPAPPVDPEDPPDPPPVGLDQLGDGLMGEGLLGGT